MIRISRRCVRVKRLERMTQRVLAFGVQKPESYKLMKLICKSIRDLNLSLADVFGCSFIRSEDRESGRI